MCSFKSIYFVIFVLNLYKTNAQISDKRLCVDQDCNEPVSLAKTLLRYSSHDPRKLSFFPNQDVKIFSKEAGSETTLWGAEINGKRGYVPKHLVREYKVFNKPKLLVDTEFKQNPQVPVDLDKEGIDPNKAQQPFEVVDGTTIYLGPQDGIKPTSTESPILATAVLPGSDEVADKTEDLHSVSDSKEKVATVKEKKEESVVNNVLSTLSNWISDDTKSEENSDAEDEEDDEDDDENEEDEEEEASVEDSENLADSQEQLQHASTEKTEDLNTLHNLPPEVKISAYNFQADQSIQANIPLTQGPAGDASSPLSSSKVNANDSIEIIKENEVLKETTASKQETTVDSSTVHSASETNAHDTPVAEDKADIKPKIEQTSSSLDTVVKESAVTEHGVENLKESADSSATVDDPSSTPTETQETKVEDSSISITTTEESAALKNQSEVNVALTVEEQEPQSKSPPVPDTDQSKTKEELNDEDKIVTETVTEPTFTDELPMPFVDDVTPDPLQGIIKGEETTEQTPAAGPPLGGEEESKTQEIPSVPPPKFFVDVKRQDDSKENLTENLHVQAQTVPEILPPPPDISATELSPTVEYNQNFEQNPTGVEEQTNAQSLFTPSFADSVLNKDLENETVEKPNDNSKKEDVSDQINPPNEENIESQSSEQNVDSEEETTSNDMEEDDTTVSKAGDINNGSEEEDEVTAEDDFVIDEDEEEQKVGEQHNQYTNGETLSNENKDNMKGSEKVSDSIKESGGIFSDLLSMFGYSIEGLKSASPSDDSIDKTDILDDSGWSTQDSKQTVIGYCDASQETCNTSEQKGFINQKGLLEDVVLNFSSDIFLYLLTTSVSVIIFLFGYMAFDRNRREAPLVARINKLEKELLITLKENELLQEKGSAVIIQEIDTVSRDAVKELTQRLTQMQMTNQALENRIAELVKEMEMKEVLEEQIESLEKELETSTEVGMELNRIISEMLDPTNGSDRLKENVEQLQRQLLEQKDTINTINVTLNEKESENQMLETELERSKKKVVELQTKLDEIVDRILKIEKEKDEQHNTLQHEIALYQQKFSQAVSKEEFLNNEIQIFKMQLAEAQRQAEIKGKEYQMLRENLNKIKLIKNDSNSLKSLLDATSAKAELQQLKVENQKYTEQLQQEQSLKAAYEKKYQAILEENNLLQQKYEQADKEKVEAGSKLEVLNNYFRKREAELQEELIKYKSIWEVKEGEATSTTERIKHMQEEIENYKVQNEALKQEIISQEIDLKSQISMLEKKVHENWVTARQMDRKLEDARQEAAQLRNRLTLRERVINEERSQNRLQSPLEQNGELPLSPHAIDSPASPPLLYGGRDHITKSPPLPGMPPFLPPHPGAPFMPPPIHGMPPFMPPPPSMYPGDHRPPPLGRMSSPPLNSRYSPENSGFSPYNRHSPSPPYDSEYGASPPPMRGYSPYNNRDDRRDYKRPPHVRNNGRNMKGSVMSSGSDHSNDSLDKLNRKQSKLV